MSTDFDEFFRTATGLEPLPYQRRLANCAAWPARIEIPTGLGKTAAVVLAWLHRRRRDPVSTPRRLVYCLPMRVLVDQCAEVTRAWLKQLRLSTRVVVLMGGLDIDRDWDIALEDEAIIFGTQDMLLSRALNRGYGMSRYRWPLHFGLLNNDCQWVIDEVQLVGSGVATTAQLQAFRRKLGTVGPSSTTWMSATLEERWLRKVDVEDADLHGRLVLEDEDHAHRIVDKRFRAQKRLTRGAATIGDSKKLATEILTAHRCATRTIAIVNTVERARELFIQLQKAKSKAALVLIHSRFRSAERRDALERALAAPVDDGTIVVSTQVIEAGVDLTSATLFSEVAPWASLVQRFGRCNRRGEDPEARVIWIGLPEDDKERAKLDKPYRLDELMSSQQTLAGLEDVGPASLPQKPLELAEGLVLRRRDLLDLFDTTPDLAGNDVDVSRFIRDADDHDIRLCWRDFKGEPQNNDHPSPARDELCSIPIGVVRDWLKAKKPRSLWTWNGLRGRWTPVDRVYPGLTLLARSVDGGYDVDLGLDPKGTALVPPVLIESHQVEDDREYEGDPESEWRRWYTLSAHSEDVAKEAEQIAKALDLPPELLTAAVTAGRWHDAGKAHPVWQVAAKKLGTHPPAAPVAKSQAEKGRITYERPGFRHELASALLALQHGHDDLVCFLIACHHGKVRVSIRSLPTEKAPKNDVGSEDPTIRYARGIWDGDAIPSIDLGSGILVLPTTLTLRYMELGDDDATGPSWLSRVLALRDDPQLGPFRLALLEGLIKSADERASRRVSGQS